MKNKYPADFLIWYLVSWVRHDSAEQRQYGTHVEKGKNTRCKFLRSLTTSSKRLKSFSIFRSKENATLRIYIHEINFEDSKSVKSTISTHSEALNFDFYEFLHF